MLYVSYKLYISKNKFLGLHVVQVKNGKFVSFYPFEKECESMCWVDTIMLTNHNVEHQHVDSVFDLLPSEFVADDLYAYRVDETADNGGYVIKKLS